MTTAVIDQYIKEIKKEVSALREKKGKSEATIKLVDSLLVSAHDLVVTLLLEKHLLYQHIVMEEISKPEEKQDKKRKSSGLQNMQKETQKAYEYIKINKLDRWLSRAYRCLGRVEDYTGNYKKAVHYYRNAIKYSDLDPEVVGEGLPRKLEYEGFLAYSTMMSGQIEKGLNLAIKVYKDFDKGVGSKLKLIDYPTWIIWKSGIPIRMVYGLIELGEDFDRKKMEKWINDAESILVFPKESKKWEGKVDFRFRKDEIVSLRDKISLLD